MRRGFRGALAVLFVLAVAYAKIDFTGSDYVGSAACGACHQKDYPEILTAHKQSAHALAMQRANDKTIVADFAGAPFAREEARYVLGRGRHAQAYLTRDLKVLPGEWVVADKKWIPLEAVDGATECVGCHVTSYDPETKKWKELGVGCEMCHGPAGKHMVVNKDTSLDPADLEPKEQAQVCGRCHSRGREKTGQHAFPVGSLPTDDLAACFTDGQPDKAGMNQEYSDLIRSPKHWAEGVVCTTCHDSHGDTDNPRQLRKPITDTCMRCHKAALGSLDKHVADKGVTAPPNATCATCHMPDGRHMFDRTVRAAL
ncbi:MAG: hypothetical protein HYU66_18380 [Armatimonadetes bacterium]|nr:hypothetical protein [Armatimonadota bacterium]